MDTLDVYVVDDEPLVREGLKLVIGQIPGFRVIGEFSTGRQIIEKLHSGDRSPKIIIMDVMMHDMDGLSALKIIKQEYPWMKVLILSGHDDFDYVKKALRFDAEDYLLKPVNINALKVVLQTIRDKIGDEKRSHQEMENLRRVAEEKWNLQRQTLCKELITGRKTLTRADTQLHELCLDEEQLARILIISVDTSIEPAQEQRDSSLDLLQLVIDKATAIITGRGIQEFLAFMEDGEVILFIKAENSESFSSFSSYLRREISMYISMSCTLAMSDAYQFRMVHYAYQEAKKRLSYRLVKGPGRCFSKDLQFQNISKELYQNELRGIIEAFKAEKFETITADVLKLIRNIKKNEISPGTIIDICLEICTDVWKVAEKLNPELAYWVNELKIREDIEKMRTFDEVESWLTGSIEDLIHKVSGQNTLSFPVKEALKYIALHYSKGISLTEVAKQVNLSVPYLSTMLKKETHKSFVHHVLDLKMQEAKKLLIQTDLNISEIAWQLGYENPRYFSEVFKKHTNISPLAYRKKYI